MNEKPYQLICGDALEQVKRLESASIDCCISSPPYWNLRNYNFDGQWGLEPTFNEYLEKLWSLMDEVWRVLKPTGTAWINLGDTYGTQSGAMRDGKFGAKNTNNQAFIQPKSIHKSLLLIPHRFAIGCSERGWILRNDIIWSKRNAMPESVTDRFSKKHEYFFFMAKQAKYYFDLNAVRCESIKPPKPFNSEYQNPYSQAIQTGGKTSQNLSYGNPNGKNPGSVSDFWDIPTRPSSAKHYATFNTELIDKPIKAGCPEFVCKACGKPREKIIERANFERTRQVGIGQDSEHGTKGRAGNAVSEIKGLTDCGCNAGFEGGVILDPFCGTSTTGVRALQLDRKFIGIDGSKEYIELAEQRLSETAGRQPLFATA
ncbi:MAG: site-specific DNA-methyltransferase [Acidobacteriota bacterium]|nr:site-specific DNA-methyltransferase [Acidobacteriota bacterium]